MHYYAQYSAIRPHTPRYRIGMRAYECLFSGFWGIYALGNTVNRGSLPPKDASVLAACAPAPTRVASSDGGAPYHSARRLEATCVPALLGSFAPRANVGTS